MNPGQVTFKIVWRSPSYPTIIIGGNELLSASNIDKLALCCVSLNADENENIVKVIDSTGEEFWYSPKEHILTPGFTLKKWTKKQIIELYNSSTNASKNNILYSSKSLSS